MKKRFRDISLRFKTVQLILVVALIPLVIFGTVIIYLYSDAIEKRSRNHIDENIRIMTSKISGGFDVANLCSNYITLNINQIDKEDIKQEIVKENRINSLLSQSVLLFEGMDSIVFVDIENNLYASDLDLIYEFADQILESTYIEELKTQNGATKLFDFADNNMLSDKPIVTMGKRVINIVTGETIGYLLINMTDEYLIESVQNEISYYMVFDKLGTCIFEYQDEYPIADRELCQQLYENKDLEQISYQGEKYLVARSTIDSYGWTVIGITNLNEFNVTAHELVTIIFCVGCVIAILIGFAIYASTVMITRPLMKLKKSAEEIANGNLDVELSFRTKDEIGELGEIFNRMATKVRDLLHRVDVEGMKKREYELALIQEQVKPHFLYNTLDIIIVLIEMKREREAARVTRKLADYYKNSLSSSEDIISIEKEVQIVVDYLDLQMIRYGDKFSYDVDLDKSVKDVKIPKLTLQPIVENAIYHGLKYKEEWGNIRITVAQKDSDIIIVVKDDGIGMDEQKLEEIRQFAKAGKNHFGVYSVNHRLLLYYGEGYDLQIDSEQGKGTSVTIRIPGE